MYIHTILDATVSVDHIEEELHARLGFY